MATPQETAYPTLKAQISNQIRALASDGRPTRLAKRPTPAPMLPCLKLFPNPCAINWKTCSMSTRRGYRGRPLNYKFLFVTASNSIVLWASHKSFGEAIWPHNEQGLENLARYIIRASFSQERPPWCDPSAFRIFRLSIIPKLAFKY